MRFIKKNKKTTLLCKLLAVLILIQPLVPALAMAVLHGSSPQGTNHHHTTQPPVNMGGHQHTTQGSVDQDSLPADDQNAVNDCCAAAVCCAGINSDGPLPTVFPKAGTPVEYQVHFQAITLPIEIKPPRSLWRS